MPQFHVRKSTKGQFDPEIMAEAVKLVLEGAGSARAIAKARGLSHATLDRYVLKIKDNPDAETTMQPNYVHTMVFSIPLEEDLKEYIIMCAKMFYGLCYIQIREKAYQLAVANGLNYPAVWEQKKMAGKSWMLGFMHRHSKELSLRSAEATSLSRATSFTKPNVLIFYDNLEGIYKRYPSLADGSRVLNIDEVGTTTVPPTQKVVAKKGIKQVNGVTSGERGTLVTTCPVIAANGSFLPPAMVFPRVNFKDHMLAEGFPGTLGLAAPSGWMNQKLFLEVIKHIVRKTCCSKDNPVLLIYDNHESHLSVEAVNYAKSNGAIILTLPPHSSNKMQPLDVGIFSPFQTFYSVAVTNWLMQNPGKPMTIYNVAKCVNYAMTKSFTPSNIQNAFKKCGIFPFDKFVFGDEDFLCNSVTDRPDPTLNVPQNPVAPVGPTTPNPNPNPPPVTPSTSADKINPATPSFSGNASSTATQSNTPLSTTPLSEKTPSAKKAASISPKDLFGYPKAAARKNTTKGRKKGRSFIPTDTPEKRRLEEEAAERERKKKKTAAPNLKRRSLFTDKVAPKKRKQAESESEEEESAEDDSESDASTSDESIIDFPLIDREPCKGDFVVVKYLDGRRKTPIHYVGQIMTEKDIHGNYEVNFYRESLKMRHKFVLPLLPDISNIVRSDILHILPPPLNFGSTKRQNSFIQFEVNFSNLNMR